MSSPIELMGTYHFDLSTYRTHTIDLEALALVSRNPKIAQRYKEHNVLYTLTYRTTRLTITFRGVRGK